MNLYEYMIAYVWGRKCLVEFPIDLFFCIQKTNAMDGLKGFESTIIMRLCLDKMDF